MRQVYSEDDQFFETGRQIDDEYHEIQLTEGAIGSQQPEGGIDTAWTSEG